MILNLEQRISMNTTCWDYVSIVERCGIRQHGRDLNDNNRTSRIGNALGIRSHLPLSSASGAPMKTIIIKELGKEFTIAKKYTGTYQDIKVPKGWELIDCRDALTILDSELFRGFIFPNDEDNYIAIPCAQLNIDKKRNFSRWTFRDRGYYLNCWDVRLLYSDADGRVVFSRKVKP